MTAIKADPTPPAEAVEISDAAWMRCDKKNPTTFDRMEAALTALLRAGWKLEPPGGAAMTEAELEEWIAKAIQRDTEDCPWEQCAAQHIYLSNARAAIRAMREAGLPALTEP